MARIFRDSSVLNQFGSPSINSNTFANRPAFGQVGRLFVDTTNNIIQRDTGTSWVTISGGAGTQNLQSVTNIGNTTTVGIFAGASGSLTAGRLLEVKGKSLLTDTSGNVLFIGLPSITPNTSTLDVYGYTSIRNTVNTAANLGPLLYAQYELNYSGTQLSGFANSIFAQDIYNVSASTTVASSTQSGTSLNINTYKFTSASTITFTQPAGTIRAATALTAYSQFQNTAVGTITHAAGISILGIENIGGSGLNITNNYQLLINASNEFASTATITNRWGIYQAGANDWNYFGSKVLIGTVTPISDEILRVAGIARIDNVISINDMFAVNRFYILNGDQQINNGNLLIKTTTNPNLVSLKVTGDIEITTTTSTGAHTTSNQHLPIYVNNVKYYLALLNP